MIKKIIVVSTITLLLLTLLSVSSAEDIDLTSFSWDELIALSTKINTELISRPEFKQVKVPAGTYKVGQDIPAGKWTITSTDGACDVYWGEKLDKYGVSIPFSETIGHLDSWGSEKSVTWDLIENTYIVIKINPVTFKPYIPLNLGF